MNYDISSKEILITGGTGQVGSLLIENLLTENVDITVLGRNRNNLKEIEPLVKKNLIKFIQCDLTKEHDLDNIKKFISNTNYLVHLASDLNPESENPFVDAFNSIVTNFQIIPNLVKHLQHLDGICYSSSVAVYGVPNNLPLNEKSPTNPTTFYGCGKLGAEKYLQLHCTAKSIPLEILRLAPIYGPRNRSKQVIPTLIKKAIKNETITLSGNGKTFRDFLHVIDAIDAITLCIHENKNNCYNIGSGIKNTIKEVAETIIDITNSKSILSLTNNMEGFNSLIDISYTTQNLNFIPKISLNEGLKSEITWHQENPN